MITFIEAFPFKEIRRPDGNYFDSWEEARAAGYADNQIWSIVEGDADDEVWVYGPPHHWVNVIGFIATEETHDFDTYYQEHF